VIRIAVTFQDTSELSGVPCRCCRAALSYSWKSSIIFFGTRRHLAGDENMTKAQDITTPDTFGRQSINPHPTFESVRVRVKVRVWVRS
jgi:hypothetical protein